MSEEAKIDDPDLERHLTAAVQELPSVLEPVLGTEAAAALQQAFQSPAPGEGTPSTTSLPEGQAGGAAQVPVLHVAAARAHAAASTHANELGCGVITVTFDASGAYQFRSGDINVTYAIGLLHRAILSLQNSAQATPFR